MLQRIRRKNFFYPNWDFSNSLFCLSFYLFCYNSLTDAYFGVLCLYVFGVFIGNFEIIQQNIRCVFNSHFEQIFPTGNNG